MVGKETKILDPADGFALLTDAFVLTDSSVVKRSNRWWMYLAGRAMNRESIELFSASLPEGAPLAATGWSPTARSDDRTRIADLAGRQNSKSWDLKGGRHCPSYVSGWDPQRKAWVERIYYAGGANNVWGPYTIGYLQWDGGEWVDQPAPAFTANEDWEHGSVYEPNLIYHDGKWKMWYVAGSNSEDYIVQGYSESRDGRTGWREHQVFLAPEEKVFDFCVVETQKGYEAVFSCGLEKRGLSQRRRLARGCSGPDCGGPLSLFVRLRASVTSTDRRNQNTRSTLRSIRPKCATRERKCAPARPEAVRLRGLGG